MVPRGPLPTRRTLAARSADILGSVPAAQRLGRRAPRVHGPVSSPRRRRPPRPARPALASPRSAARRAPFSPARGRALPAFAASRRPAAARSRAQRKPGRRPSPDPSPDPAAQPRGPQPTRARPARAQPTTAGPAAAALTSARRPAHALPAPGSRRDGTSPLAVGSPGCWEGQETGAGRARGQCAAEIAPPRVRKGRPGGVRERFADQAWRC
ncbi:translation initiation factor IF-2-like [Phoca vitulina]|uniref:translation initiation factor IF-2-like n=1 Tax=Phoca vitulina TaxID=9720 RepID=UPI001395F4D2|nr:translation initiation factor IF-2-like [Phoca vitulina]